MKNRTSLFLSIGFTVLGGIGLYAQSTNVDDKKTPDFKVKKRTLMEQFEPDMVISVDDRINLKKKRYAYIKNSQQIIDTLEISLKKKRKLLKELYKNPLSDRLKKALTTDKTDAHTSSN